MIFQRLKYIKKIIKIYQRIQRRSSYPTLRGNNPQNKKNNKNQKPQQKNKTKNKKHKNPTKTNKPKKKTNKPEQKNGVRCGVRSGEMVRSKKMISI